jgi:signal transduction histidine kinase
MKNEALAQWLQDHTDMLGRSDDPTDKTLYEALYEGIIDIALHGETEMVDTVLESAAAHAVGTGRRLTNLLGVPQRLREKIWHRLGEEIDPEPGFVMLTAVDAIFVHIIRVMIDAYLEAHRLSQVEKAVEVSQLYSESEKRVMHYAAEVARANRELARLEQAKTDFISIAAHELKTPLTLIQGYVNILRDLKEMDERTGSFIEGIYRGSQRMNTIIENMLDLSAMDTSQLNLAVEQVNLKSIIDLIVAQQEQTLRERRHTIEITTLEELPRVEGDPARLHQIFNQIISNAIKYTPDGGQIIIRGETISATDNSPERVKISVKDTGIGIAPEDRDRIFEKFYRSSDSKLHSTGETKFMGAGPGLGLAIVKGLAEAHGGRVWADSQGFDQLNCPGSTFNILLPVEATPPAGIKVKWMDKRQK